LFYDSRREFSEFRVPNSEFSGGYPGLEIDLCISTSRGHVRHWKFFIREGLDPRVATAFSTLEDTTASDSTVTVFKGNSDESSD